MATTFHHRVPRADLGLGLVVVSGIDAGPAPSTLADELTRLVERRRTSPLAPAEEEVRRLGRDLLRNGQYKPTGRGKPASEYLVRAASEGAFPRVNGPVDANNLVSLGELVAISVWDLGLAATRDFEFRLGRAGESYVFNAAGQVLGLEDLVCGCGLLAGGRSQPMVTPVKDGLATKLRPETREVAGCIYFPLEAGGPERLREVTRELERWLALCGPASASVADVCLPGGSVTLPL